MRLPWFRSRDLTDSERASDRFMLEEYRNIAETHDKQRDLILRLVNYALILSAVPATLAGVLFRTSDVDLGKPPASLCALILLVAVGDFIFAASIHDATLNQYLYAKTVNLVRKYFAERNPHVVSYLYLPTTPDKPGFSKPGRADLALLVTLIGAVYLAYGTVFMILDVRGPVLDVPGFFSLGLLIALIAVVCWFVYIHLAVKSFEREYGRSNGTTAVSSTGNQL